MLLLRTILIFCYHKQHEYNGEKLSCEPKTYKQKLNLEPQKNLTFILRLLLTYYSKVQLFYIITSLVQRNYEKTY